MPVVLIFVARRFEFCCPWKCITLPMVFYSVARGNFIRCPSFFRGVGHAEKGAYLLTMPSLVALMKLMMCLISSLIGTWSSTISKASVRLTLPW